jgi:hypothetical protein
MRTIEQKNIDLPRARTSPPRSWKWFQLPSSSLFIAALAGLWCWEQHHSERTRLLTESEEIIFQTTVTTATAPSGRKKTADRNEYPYLLAAQVLDVPSPPRPPQVPPVPSAPRPSTVASSEDEE